MTLTLPSQNLWAVSASIVMTTSGSIVVSPQSTTPSSPSIIFTVICDSGLRYWYWTIVFALRNFGASSSSVGEVLEELADVLVDLLVVLEVGHRRDPIPDR